MSEVVTIIKKSGRTQKEIAKILGISAPKVSALMTGKINDFSNDTLMHYLTLLGCNVEIRVIHQKRTSSRKMTRGRMQVKRSVCRNRRVKIKRRSIRTTYSA